MHVPAVHGCTRPPAPSDGNTPGFPSWQGARPSPQTRPTVGDTESDDFDTRRSVRRTRPPAIELGRSSVYALGRPARSHSLPDHQRSTCARGGLLAQAITSKCQEQIPSHCELWPPAHDRPATAMARGCGHSPDGAIPRDGAGRPHERHLPAQRARSCRHTPVHPAPGTLLFTGRHHSAPGTPRSHAATRRDRPTLGPERATSGARDPGQGTTTSCSQRNYPTNLSQK